MRRLVLSALAAGALAAGSAACTPLGLWLYDDPRISVNELTVALDQSAEPFGVTLRLENPNDFDVTIARVETELSLDGRSVSRATHEQPSTLPDGGDAQVRVPMQTSDSVRQALSAQLATGTHRYLVQGRVTLNTPIGERRVSFQSSGSGSFQKRG
jgi:LEA14-like dessication related protein